MTAPAPRWASHKTVREYLNISDATLYRYASTGVLTRRTIGGVVRYDLNEVDARLRGGTSLTDLDADAAADSTAADVIARIRAALPAGTGKPLIPLVQVHAAIDKVAAELGVDGSAS